VTPKGQTRDPNTLRVQYLENKWRCYLAAIANYYLVCCVAVRSAMLATAWLLVLQLMASIIGISPFWLPKINATDWWLLVAMACQHTKGSGQQIAVHASMPRLRSHHSTGHHWPACLSLWIRSISPHHSHAAATRALSPVLFSADRRRNNVGDSSVYDADRQICVSHIRLKEFKK